MEKVLNRFKGNHGIVKFMGNDNERYSVGNGKPCRRLTGLVR